MDILLIDGPGVCFWKLILVSLPNKRGENAVPAEVKPAAFIKFRLEVIFINLGFYVVIDKQMVLCMPISNL